MEDAFKVYTGTFTTSTFSSTWDNDGINSGTNTFDADITNWDCRLCTDFCSMFFDCTTFNLDISGWGNGTDAENKVFDRDGVTTISFRRMFQGATLFNQDISGWKVYSVGDFRDMFNGATAFTQNLSSWKTNGTGMQNDLGDAKYVGFWTGATAHVNSGDDVTYLTWETKTCFYGFVNIMTKDGLKQIKNLKREDLVLTNSGYQKLTKLLKSFPSENEDHMVKISKNFLKEGVPSEDIYVSGSHPLSIKIISDENDKDFEYLHLFVSELLSLDGINNVYLNEEKFIYNLMFDKQYEVNIGGMKFLSHHPNHFNGNIQLISGEEIAKENRSKKIYALNKQIFFEITSLKDLLQKKPESMTDKEFLASVLQF
tara:strand:- start:12 stop:1121 length:1110 start_codon:yes stop_codon:yes gene_type:complete